MSKKYLHEIHYSAWKKGLKSMYYLRSSSLQRADKVSIKVDTKKLNDSSGNIISEVENNKYDECLSCQ